MFANVREALAQHLEDDFFLLGRNRILLAANVDVGLDQVYPAELVHQLQQRGQQPLRPDGLWPQRLQNVAGAGQDFLRHGAELRQQLARVVRVALAPLFVILEQRHHGRQVRGESVVDLAGKVQPLLEDSDLGDSACQAVGAERRDRFHGQILEADGIPPVQPPGGTPQQRQYSDRALQGR